MKWLHISDIHYDSNSSTFATEQLLANLKTLFDEGIRVDEVFYTGDFRYFPTQPKATREIAQQAADKLREIASWVGVHEAEKIHITPGNHDIVRKDSSVLEHIFSKYDSATGKIPEFIDRDGSKKFSCSKYLWSQFEFFFWVAEELNNQIWSNPSEDNQLLYHRVGKIADKYNVVYLNTALDCGQSKERGQLKVGFEHINQALKALSDQLPTIVLGHHGLGCFTRKERERIKKIFHEYNIKLYLCGDEHVGGIDEFNSTLQLTAGCLNQAGGVQPTFYIGNINTDGSFSVEAYIYHEGEYPGWTLYTPMCNKISTWTTRMFPAIQITNDVVFGRDDKIREITDYLSSSRETIAEVWGIAGIGKTTVCNEVINALNIPTILVDTKSSNTTTAIQRSILKQLGVNVDKVDIDPDKYAELLMHKAKERQMLLYLDNAEWPIMKDRTLFPAWLYNFVRESKWNVLYSTQEPLNAERYIKSFPLESLEDDDAYNMFISRRCEADEKEHLTDEEKELARDIAVNLLSCYPIAIVLATSQMQNMRYSLTELANALKKRVKFEFTDDHGDHHRSISAALSLTVAGIDSDETSTQAKELWAMLAQYPGKFTDDLFSLAYGDKTKYYDARLVLRKFGLIAKDGYAMLEPIKAEALNFTQEEKETSRNLLFKTLANLFMKGFDARSEDRQKWHHLSLACFEFALLLLSDSNLNSFDMVQSVVSSAHNYFQFAPHISLETLHKLEQLYRDERANLGLANVLKAMGDLESRLGQIDAAQNHYGQAEQLYRDERDNLGLANVLQAMGDLERRLGQIDAAISKYLIALGLYGQEQELMGRTYCLAELCRAYAIKKDKPRFREYAKATVDAIGSVSNDVAKYAVACIQEAMDAMGVSLDDKDDHS